MQLILLERVVNLGQLGDIVKVKDGYGRNFLIPQGKAKRATEKNKAEFEVRRAELEKQQAAIFADAQSRAEKLEGQLVKISQKAGVDGRLFGSVTNTDIAEALNAMGFDVAKADIRMPNGHFKQIGDYPITVALHHEAVANITVSVLGES
ncbi:MAG: 50S ribosomal protein L9 [Betaproteobacteria bacterium CG2_30_59_46]|nr:MAG: 50S ribosomal protein L9 [Betaproteobacteria bacterium CG2_30_59_46]PIQ14257.1 MAG: 50S ribosomal protein L9 [Hydrogenophilales bacterium CG18_big_fil_WC_8_21_14_2_50_58_12]PIX98840.1 MAG: 50S ribosomal protein L9 [Hydrogenophilales bacterium CG_4_10_14_3_um_filter_58_23]PJB08166.1 MAG: 50S ribosomal protein L9 [Hydrogenophilales bacterium CG_4_9_14_3_um_filter_59_35]